MTVIWKYPLASKWVENVNVHMVRPVHVGLDPAGVPSVWIEVDPDGPATNCIVTIAATGEPIPEDAGEHAGSFTEGPYVWHVFLAISPAEQAPMTATEKAAGRWGHALARRAMRREFPRITEWAAVADGLARTERSAR